MNYKRIYDNLTGRGKERPYQKGIHERHHIIPKSMGGNNDPDNISNLTPREHFICHLLLVKFTTGEDKKKMAWALHRMSHSKGRTLTSIEYEMARNEHIRNVSQPKSEETRKRMSGKKSVEHTEKIRLAALNNSKINELSKDPLFQAERIRALKNAYPDGVFKGRNHSEETKDKIRNIRLGSKASPETKAKLSDLRSGQNNSMYDKTHTEESKEKMRQAWQRRKERNYSNG